MDILSHRAVWACLFVALLLTLNRRWDKVLAVVRQPRQIARLALAALLVGSNWLIFLWAVAHQQVVASSLGYFLTPLVNVLLGLLVLKERLNRLEWFSVALALAAIGNEILALGSLPWISLLLATTFGCYGLVRKQVPVDAISGLWLETLAMLPVCGIYALWQWQDGHQVFVAIDTSTTLLLIGAGILTALPLMAFAAATQRLDLATVGMLMYINPTLQFLTAVWLFGEPMQSARLASFALIWLGCSSSVGACGANFGRRKSADRSSRSAPAARLEQADAGGHRNIQAIDSAVHRDTHQLVAILARQAAHALAFGAQHPGRCRGPFGSIQVVLRLASRADHPDFAFLQFTQRTCQVGDHHVGHRFGGTAGGFGGHVGQADGPVLGRNYRMNAGRIGDTQTGTEIARIGDAVEHEQESGLFEGIEHIIEMRHLAPAFDPGDHPLVFGARCHAVEPLAVSRHHLDSLQLGVREQVTGPPVVARRVDDNLLDGFGIVTELGGYGVETVDQTGRHGGFQ